jgi:hypothetical protein
LREGQSEILEPGESSMTRNPRRTYDEQGRELQPITVGWLR